MKKTQHSPSPNSPRDVNMRFPKEKIREFLLDPNADLRYRAASYLADLEPPDPEAMPLVIQAVEKYGRDSVPELFEFAPSFAQSATTLDWLIRELNTGDSDPEDDCLYRLSWILSGTSPASARSRADEILNCRGLNQHAREWFRKWLPLLSWDADTCWRKLQELSKAGEDTGEDTEDTEDETIDLSRAYTVAEAAAQHGKELESRVRAVLSEALAGPEKDSIENLLPLAIRLAGKARMESTVNDLVELLNFDDEEISSESYDALMEIGTPAVVQALAGRFESGTPDFRGSAIRIVGTIHDDAAVEQSLQWQRQAENRADRIELARILLSHFASEGIAIARGLLLQGMDEPDEQMLLRELLENCAITGDRFPEYEQWLAIDKAAREEHQKLMDNPGAFLQSRA